MTPDEAWLDLCEQNDRTSLADYPDICLITKEELRCYMQSATRVHLHDTDEEECR